MGVMIETPLETHRSQIWQEWLLLLYYFCQNESLNPHYHLMGFNENQLQWRLQVSSDRNKVIDEMIQNLAQQGLRRKFLESLQLVAEEWLMNAFYDAPVSFEGYSFTIIRVDKKRFISNNPLNFKSPGMIGKSPSVLKIRLVLLS